MSSMRTAHPRKGPEPATPEPAPAPAPRSEPSPEPAPEPAAARPLRPTRRTDLVKFTATLEPETVDQFERVTASMRSVGRLAGGRYPSRADVLRAVLVLVEGDPALAERVRDQVRADLTTPDGGQTA